MPAAISLYLDTRSKLKSGNHPLKLRLYYRKKPKLLPVTIGNVKAEYTEEEFNRAMGDNPRGKYRTIRNRLDEVLIKARKLAAEIHPFNLEAFAARWGEKLTDRQNVFFWFRDREQRERNPGTLSYYRTARKSFQSYCKCDVLPIQDITPVWLMNYQEAMKRQGKSLTTVSIYARAMQSIWHDAAHDGQIHESLNPFGKRGYQIPKGHNKKKALKSHEIDAFHNYNPPEAWREAYDLFLFMFHMQGINIGDVCRLTWANVDEATGMVKFERHKTKNRKRTQRDVQAKMNSTARAIFDRYKESNAKYVFPYLSGNMNEEEQRRTIKNLTNRVNRRLKKIAKALGLPYKRLSTNFARHTFATEMKRRGLPIAEIAEMIGSGEKATENYLDSFPPEYLVERASTERDPEAGQRASD